MKRWKLPGIVALILCLALIVTWAIEANAETIRWTNPTTGIDNAGVTVPLTASEQAALKNYLRYRVATGTWTYFGETTGGKTSWTGTLSPAVGVAAEYSVSAALRGADGIERDSVFSVPYAYTVPFPPGPTPGSPSGTIITRP